MQDELLSVDEVAEMLGISPRTLENRIAYRKCHPPYRRIGRGRIFVRREVIEWVLRQPVRRASDDIPVPRRRGRPTKKEQIEGGA